MDDQPNDQMQDLAKEVTVRRYGVKLLDKAMWPVIRDAMWRQNQLWNRLVEIETLARRSYNDALAQSSPELTELNGKIEAETLSLENLLERRSKTRQAARSKSTDAEKALNADIKSLSATLKLLRAQAKELRLQAKAAAKPLVQAAEAERRAKVKVAARESGLWWAHQETVLMAYDRARIRAMKEGVMLRYHRFDQEGSLGVRFQTPGLPLSGLSDGSTALMQMRLPTQEELGHRKLETSAGDKRFIVDYRIGAKADSGEIPIAKLLMTVHGDYDMPTDAPVKTALLTCRSEAGKPRFELVMTFVKLLDAQQQAQAQTDALHAMPNSVCGVDFGFRVVLDPDSPSEKALRVATARAGSRTSHLILPAKWLRRMDKADELKSSLDVLATEFKSEILTEISADILGAAGIGEDEWFYKIAGAVRRSKGAYAAQLIKLCDSHQSLQSPLWSPEVRERARMWRLKAKQLIQDHFHVRQRALGQRQHMYRNFAAKLVEQHGMIAVKATDFGDIAKLSVDGVDNTLVQAARSNRFLASPSEARLAIVNAAKRAKREVVKVDPKNTTVTCSACGHVHEAITDLMFTCDGCGKVWDQDENSAALCAKLALESPKLSAAQR